MKLDGLVNDPADQDSIPQTDRILGDANRALVLLNQRIESARTALADLEKQREAYLQELRTLGGSGEGRTEVKRKDSSS